MQDRWDIRDEVVAVLGLLEPGERHLGARDVLLGVPAERRERET